MVKFKAYVEFDEGHAFIIIITAPTHMGALDLLSKWLAEDERDMTYLEMYPWEGHPWITDDIVELS
jgi:hypothetical protein